MELFLHLLGRYSNDKIEWEVDMIVDRLRSIPFIAIITMVILFLFTIPVEANGEIPPPPLPEGEILFDSQTAKVRYMHSFSGSSLSEIESNSITGGAESVARKFLTTYGQALGYENGAGEAPLIGERVNADGSRLLRFQQAQGGIPVLGTLITVQLDAGQQVIAVVSKTGQVHNLNLPPRLSAEKTKQIVLNLTVQKYAQESTHFMATVPELVIYDSQVYGAPGMPIQALAWKLEVRSLPGGIPPVNDFYLIDARSGIVLRTFSQIATERSIRIYDCNNSASCPVLPTLEDVPGAVSDSVDANNALNFLRDYYNILGNVGLDSFDGQGATLVAYVSYCPDSTQCPYYANAYWGETGAYFGEGFADAADVVAHEFTHGMIAKQANLIYEYQSGAISESIADIFGEFTEQYYQSLSGDDLWWLGNDIGKDHLTEDAERPRINGAYSYQRLMSDPTLGDGTLKPPGYPKIGTNATVQPDAVNSDWYACTSADNGGVHNNSGVGNKAAYLMLAGGTFNGVSVTAMSPDGEPKGTTTLKKSINKTARVWFTALDNFLPTTASWWDLSVGLEAACNSLIGGSSGISADDCTNTVIPAIQAVKMRSYPCQETRLLPIFQPQIETPLSGTVFTEENLPASIDLVWKPAKNGEAEQYRLYLSGPTGVIFNNVLIDQAGYCSDLCRVSIPHRPIFGKYTWRVQHVNGLGAGPWSAWQKFSVAVKPATEISLSIDDAPEVFEARPLFRWVETDGALSYRLVIRNSNNRLKNSAYFRVGALCDGKTFECTLRLPFALSPGSYQGYVQGSAGGKNTPIFKGVYFSVGAFPAIVSGLISPDGSSSQPAYEWDRADTITKSALAYRLQISGTSGKFNREYSEAELGCQEVSPCRIIPPFTLNGGKHQWRVQARNEVGLSAWSPWQVFNVVKPGVVYLGLLTTTEMGVNLPTYHWQAVVGNLGRKYQLTVLNTANKPVLKTWVSNTACSGMPAECIFTPETVLWKADTYSWTVRGWNAAGFGEYSPPQTYTVSAAQLPVKAPLLQNPLKEARIERNAPITLEWVVPVSSPVTHYRLWVYATPTKTYPLDGEVFTSVETGCGGGGTCAYTLAAGLEDGKYTWRVNALVNGASKSTSQSGWRSFTVHLPAPVLLSPMSGNLKANPVYYWQPVKGASRYQLKIKRGNSLLFNRSLTASTNCTEVLCSFSTPSELGDGDYTWNVTAWDKAGGNGSTSGLQPYRIGAFPDYTFDLDTDGWQPVSGAWTIRERGIYFSSGLGGSARSTTMTDEATLADIDVRATLMRTSDGSQGGGIFVRANLGPSGELNGYLFSYDNAGRFEVSKYVQGVSLKLCDWTNSRSIQKGKWNTLRVIAKGSQLTLYINGSRVWYGSDNQFSVGKIGLSMVGGTPEAASEGLLVDRVKVYAAP